MSDEKILPSDQTLDSSWRALKPGNYKPRTDLSSFKHPLIKDLDKHHHDIPLGVGDRTSAVFIYQQGTIEVVGKVYAWNKLVKPGVYSPFEKLRYLVGNEIINDRATDDQYKHHAPYNRFTVPKNPYLTKEQYGKSNTIQYHYVSFEDQITTSDGEKIYPIPILDGRLTIYPDGTFKTEGIVIESKEKRFVDQYGYLGDQANYSTVKTFYDNVTKDDVQPLNVYRIISENEDGSVTYGAIEANQDINRSKWIPIPDQLIPVNDGTVRVLENGEVQLTGTVLTCKGHRIKLTQFKINELYDHLLDEDWVDTSVVWNPQGYCDNDPFNKGNGNYRLQTLNIISKNNKKDIYQYHYFPESISVNVLEKGNQLVFKPMPGWDTFVPEIGNWKAIDFYRLWMREDEGTDFSRYPWVTKGVVVINQQHRLPTLRFNTMGDLDVYTTTDHSYFNNVYNDIVGEYLAKGKQHDRIVSELKAKNISVEDEIPRFCNYPRLKGQELVFKKGIKPTSKFYPYNNGSIKFEKNANGQTELVVKGSVIWQRGSRYFRIGMDPINGNPDEEVRCLFDESWPDIVLDKEGKETSLFSVNGYFKDEPLFIRFKHRNDNNSIGNEYNTVYGIQRKEEGLFRIVRREVTQYLSDYEKDLIRNDSGHYRDYIVKMEEANIIDTHNYYYNIPYTAKETGMKLSSSVIRLNNVLPYWMNPVSIKAISPNDNQLPISRLLHYNSGDNALYTFKDISIRLNPPVWKFKGLNLEMNIPKQTIVKRGTIFNTYYGAPNEL